MSLVETRILFEIKVHAKCIQSDIAKTLHIDKSYLSRLMKRFYKNGLIEKDKSEQDKRATYISLTEKGSVETERLKVIPFEERYRQDFINFNVDWIISNFGFLEEHDKETFEKIDEEMEAGAMIFFAVENDAALATCMAMPMEGTTWEICKLGSNKNIPHKGAGSAVFEEAMKWALNHGAERLFILFNSKLKPALHIYEKYGFKEIKLENYEYIRGDIAFEYKKEGTGIMKMVAKKKDAVKKVFIPLREDYPLSCPECKQETLY